MTHVLLRRAELRSAVFPVSLRKRRHLRAINSHLPKLQHSGESNDDVNSWHDSTTPSNSYLEPWRITAVVPEEAVSAAAISEADLNEEVAHRLRSQAFRTPPPFARSQPPNMNLVHTKGQIEYYLQRVRLSNLDHNGAPMPPSLRMRLVWWGTVKELGRLPRWPEDREHILDAEKLLEEWRNVCDDRGGVEGPCRRRQGPINIYAVPVLRWPAWPCPPVGRAAAEH